MTMQLADLLGKTAESQLQHYRYEDGLLEVRMFVPDLDNAVLIRAFSSVLLCNVITVRELADTTCFLQAIELANELSIDEHGIYVPPTNFGELMRQVRGGLSLAFGYRAPDYKYILRVSSSRPLVACLLRSLEDATWELTNK